MRRFEGKVVFITGAASGLGRAAAERFASEGASVVVADINREGADAVAAQLPGAVAVTVDTRDPDSVDAAFAEAKARYGHIDVVFNNAGIVAEQTPVHQTTEETWRNVMSVNADGAFHVLRAGLAALLESGGGNVINTSSTTALAGMPNITPYTFAKAGLIGITRSIAAEYAEYGIRVNSIAPGVVLTELVRGHIERAPDPVAMRELSESQYLLPGMPEPADIAAVVAFLASDEARWITGLTLPIDGGFSAT